MWQKKSLLAPLEAWELKSKINIVFNQIFDYQFSIFYYQCSNYQIQNNIIEN